MNHPIEMIASHLKQVRETLGLSVEEVCKALDISSEQYLNYEQAREDIPIGLLTSFCNTYDVSLANLVTGEEPKLSVYAINRKGKGMQVERYPGYDYVSLAHQFFHKKCYPFIVTVSPEKEPAKMNKHNGHEFDYVLQGSLKCKIGEKEIIRTVHIFQTTAPRLLFLPSVPDKKHITVHLNPVQFQGLHKAARQ